MIHANELRKGNKLLNDGCVVTVQFILDYLTVTTKQGNNITAHLDLVKPIPLTPEIFQRLGFEEYTKTAYRTVTKELDYVFQLAFTGRGYHSSNAYTNYPVLYVHQLQNLYFALTGKELEITL